MLTIKMDNEYVQIVSSTSFLKNNLTSLLLQYLQYKKEQETLRMIFKSNVNKVGTNM